jgi:redox-sensing transcriptional repressor
VKSAKAVPPTTIARLPIYLRCLQEVHVKNIDHISSFELAELVGGNAAQLRKDLSYLGEFGTRGVGYAVDELINQISRWLGIGTVRSVMIIGMGRLGQALCNYQGFHDKGFLVTHVFDIDPAKIGKKVAELKVQAIDELPENGPGDIGIIATPATAAQEAADRFVSSGIKAILNFAPTNIEVGQDVFVRHVDFASELQIIGFHLAHPAELLLPDFRE